ncbi:cyclase family protein [Actinomycetes bacterium M1A6_2h]
MAATESEFRAMATSVRTWGRWGQGDQLGCLNHITDATVAEAAKLAIGGRTFSLGIEFDLNGPQSPAVPFRWNPMHFVSVGGDYSADKEFLHQSVDPRAQMISGLYDSGLLRINDDFVIMPLQAGTQWDAFSHAYYDDAMYNGVSPRAVTTYGATQLGIETFAEKGITSRGVLVDVVASRGVDVVRFEDDPVEPEELEEILARQGSEVRPGDILVVRTGWWETFAQTRDHSFANNGLSWRCAQWLYDHEIAAVAADNVNVEGDTTQVDGVFLALHLLCLREMGLPLGELWNLQALAEDCARDGRYEFLLVAPPLKITGGVGSPLNPIAIK